MFDIAWVVHGKCLLGMSPFFKPEHNFRNSDLQHVCGLHMVLRPVELQSNHFRNCTRMFSKVYREILYALNIATVLMSPFFLQIFGLCQSLDLYDHISLWTFSILCCSYFVLEHLSTYIYKASFCQGGTKVLVVTITWKSRARG